MVRLIRSRSSTVSNSLDQRRSRALRLEPLERREVLTADIAAVEPPALDGSIGAYLAQEQLAGPVVPAELQSSAAPLDAQAVDAALAADAVLNPAAEGENVIPVIVDFEVYRNAGYVFVSGRMVDDNLMSAPYIILNGAQFWATIIHPNASGYFSVVEMDMGFSGTVTARAYDFNGGVSEPVSRYLA